MRGWKAPVQVSLSLNLQGQSSTAVRNACSPQLPNISQSKGSYSPTNDYNSQKALLSTFYHFLLFTYKSIATATCRAWSRGKFLPATEP